MTPATNALHESPDVLIVGAGPVGLTTANLLARYGVRVLVVEANDALLDYPRGVGLDDESLRTFQTAGLVDEVLPHTAPNHIMRFVNGRGELLAELSPATDELGWPRRNAFIQPLVDAVLAKGLERYPHAALRFGERMVSWKEEEDGLEVTLETAAGPRRVRCRYLVGADGGKSAVRRAMGVSFDGQSSSTRWLVVDLRVDPLGHPNVYVGADPARPWVSISLPHGLRRFEFMLFDGESDERATSQDFLRTLLGKLVPDAPAVDVIRSRVYTHHSRIAGAFRKGRVLVAGDAAHLMPVWQGQGFNSGIRDASNLAWKLAAVVSGRAKDALLDSYDVERRDHALAMIKLSTIVGKVVSPTNRFVARARDVVLHAIGAVPSVKAYIVGMRFKPMPRYAKGAVVHRALPIAETSPVGRLFIQPRVATREAADVMLDDVLGDWFSLVVWNNNPALLLDEDARARLDALGVKLVGLRPHTQLRWTGHDQDDVTIASDKTGALKRFFDRQNDSVLLVRPDRVVAAACPAYRTSDMIRAAAAALHAGGKA